MDNPETATLDALRRAALYRALAHSFAYPKTNTWKDLTTLWNNLANTKPVWPQNAQTLITTITQYLTTENQEPTENEYFRLFGPAAVAPPHETAYGDPGRQMAKAAHLSDIAGFFLAFGLTPRPGSDANLEDHLTMELEFMSLLNAKEAMALDEEWDNHLLTTQEAQKKFLMDHLGIWLHIWHDKVMENQPSPYFKTLTELLLELVETDATRLGIEPKRLTQMTEDTMVGGDTMECPMAAPPPEEM